MSSCLNVTVTLIARFNSVRLRIKLCMPRILLQLIKSLYSIKRTLACAALHVLGLSFYFSSFKFSNFNIGLRAAVVSSNRSIIVVCGASKTLSGSSSASLAI